VQHVKLDLLDKQAVKDTLSRTEHAKEVTHVYQNAFVFTGDDTKDIEVNHGMHVNIIEGLEAAGANLQHVYANEGGKWYGQAIGPIKTPCSEEDPRHLPPNFYYNMEDYMKDRVAHGAKWTWSALRPNPVAGYSEGSAMNIANSIAVYAVICKELGIAMRFPGSEFSWNAVNDVCDADLLADAMIYISTNPQCHNQGFNINNGDLFRWKWLWPKLAAHFGLECGPIMPMSLDKQMADKEELWSKIVEKHKLKKKALKEITTWTFADFVLKQPSDWFQNTTKLKKTGYTGMCLDTEEMYVKIFKQMEDARVIPKYVPIVACEEPGAQCCVCCRPLDDLELPGQGASLEEPSSRVASHRSLADISDTSDAY
jgi:nucleoside-diphosphate-sugar epimerase